MPGQTSGGGARRRPVRGWTPAEAALHDVLIDLDDEYRRARGPVTRILRDYLAPFDDVRLADLSPAQRLRRRLALFTGSAWNNARREVAEALYQSDAVATARINAAIPDVFAQSASIASWQFFGAEGGGGQTSGGGAGRGEKPGPRAYTDADIAVYLTLKALSYARDIAWLLRKVQSAAMAVTAADTPPDAAPDAIAHHVTHTVHVAMSAAAQAALYAARDAAVYQAGLDAQADGAQVEKTWLGIPDNRIRDSHYRLHGTTLPLNGVFHGLHGDLRYPHDPAAPPAETYRCRCRLAIHPPGRAPDIASGILTPSQVGTYKQWREMAIAAGLRRTRS